jgi:ribosomal protein L11 methylase PrmA
MATQKTDKWLFAATIAIVLGVTFVSAQEQKKDVPYVPTPQVVVDKMLEVAAITKNDVVYDLGSGDGRIVITAAKKYGVRGVGVDIDPERIKEANANAVQAGVADHVKFIEQDLFKTDLKEASVVTLYLLPEVNLRLRPKLWSELKPGTRVVSHAFDMGDWKPEKTIQVEGRTIYYWVIPEGGTPKN